MRRVVRFVGLLLAATMLAAAMVFVGGLAAPHSSVAAQTVGDGEGAAPPEVCTAVRHLPPFVDSVDGELDGFAIGLWEEIGSRLGFEPSYQPVDSVQEQLDIVASGECDAATTAISITSERDDIVDFSHPTNEGGLRIAVPEDPESGLGLIAEVFSSRVVMSVLGLLIVAILVVGVLVWVIERRENPEFSEKATEGIPEGLWWSSVTAMTVGYGDKIPRHGVARLLTVIWMFTAVTLVAIFTAAVATELTVDRINSSISSVDDLAGKDVLVVEGTTSQTFADDERIASRSVDAVDELIEELASGKADAGLYDAPILEFQESGPAAGDIVVVGPSLNVEHYGVAFPPDSELRRPVNHALLETIEDGTYDALYDRWFG